MTRGHSPTNAHRTIYLKSSNFKPLAVRPPLDATIVIFHSSQSACPAEECLYINVMELIAQWEISSIICFISAILYTSSGPGTGLV